MKFGKQLQAERIPGWSAYYLDYKALKKIISSFSKKGESEAIPQIPDAHTPLSILNQSGSQPPLQSLASAGDDRGPVFQRHRAFFFFKLERELDKINTFYLQKEAELKLRLETLLSKRQSAAKHIVPSDSPRGAIDHAEWKAVEEGFQIFQRDLDKLQQFIEMNATGFRKILKKWDKRSKSTTKELYLSRQVEVQPVFDRKLIAEMSDTVATCLLDLTNVSVDLIKGSGTSSFGAQSTFPVESPSHTFHDLERSLQESAASNNEPLMRSAIARANEIAQEAQYKTQVLRILWKAVLDAKPPLADLVMSCPPFSFDFVDDINGRTYLHEAAISGQPRLAGICMQNGIEVDRQDAYGRTALHYAAIHGHDQVCECLLEHASSLPDLNAFIPLVYAVSNGHVKCVRVLLTRQIEARNLDRHPLSIACENGHKEIVTLLLASGFACEPNTNGEYPIHHAARNGHSDLCELLVSHKGFDIADKFNEWTPLFHAARYGHLACVNSLLQAGANPLAIDEFNRSPSFYAAWYGHIDVLSTLLAASHGSTSESLRPPGTRQGSHTTPSTSSDAAHSIMEEDLDAIPSLSLPPPIMPFRSYGHNYLQSSHLIQICLGRAHPQPNEQAMPVRLIPKLLKRVQEPSAELAVKVVFSCKSETVAGPLTFTLPTIGERPEVMFQIPSLDDLYLEISLHPSVGTKIIGRAIFLPSAFRDIRRKGVFTSPLLDQHLQIIGEIDFEICVISPFQDIALNVGGAAETYWKSSTSTPGNVLSQPEKTQVGRLSQNSPRNLNLATPPASNNLMTSSSLSGEYLSLSVQVTKDLMPVISDSVQIPKQIFALGVADVSYEHLATFLGSTMTGRIRRKSGHTRGYDFPPFLKLQDALEQLPLEVNVHLQTLYFGPRDSRHSDIQLNEAVDSILRVVYHVQNQGDKNYGTGKPQRRRFIFTSFDPDVCAALNWKQPNYPVILAPTCGLRETQNALWPIANLDNRCSSLANALAFVRANNLLGICVPANTLIKLPALALAIKETGVMLMSEGTDTHAEALRSLSTGHCIDGFKTDGLVQFFDLSNTNKSMAMHVG